MDDHSESNLSKNYLTVLKKITASESKDLDNSYLEKLLSNLRIEYGELETALSCDGNNKLNS